MVSTRRERRRTVTNIFSTLSDDVLLNIALFRAHQLPYVKTLFGGRKVEKDYAREQRWWVDPAGPVGELFLATHAGPVFRLVCRRFARLFSVEAAAARAGGRRVLLPAIEDVDAEDAEHIVDEGQSLPVLGFAREPAAHALLGRAEAILQWHKIAGQLPFLCWPCCSADSLEEMEYRLADCLAGREWSVDVVDVTISIGEDDFLPRDVAACEKLFDFATALLPPGAVAPELPADLLALRAAPRDYPGWGWGAAADAVSTYKYQAPGYAEDQNIPFGQLSFSERVENEIDLRAHLRTLGPKEREDKRKGAPRWRRFVTSRDVVTRRAMRFAALPWDANEVEDRGSGEHYRYDNNLCALPGGFAFTTDGAFPPGSWRGLGGGLSGAARHLGAVVRAEARALADEDHPDRAGYLNRLDLWNPPDAADAEARERRLLATARARVAALTARTASLRRFAVAPLVLELARLRRLRRDARAEALGEGALATVTRPDLPDVLFRHVAGFICPVSSSAATRGGVRLRSVSIAFGFMEAADAIDWQKLDWPRDPYEPDEFLAPEGAVCWDNGAIVPKVDLVFEVPIPEAEEQGYASATLVVTGFLSGFGVPFIGREETKMEYDNEVYHTAYDLLNGGWSPSSFNSPKNFAAATRQQVPGRGR